MEVMVACSFMASIKEVTDDNKTKTSEISWEDMKRGGLIGAAALTGGTLMAITGGMKSVNFKKADVTPFTIELVVFNLLLTFIFSQA